MKVELESFSTAIGKPVYLAWDFQNVRFPRKSNPAEYLNEILTFARLMGELRSSKVYAYWRKEVEAIEEDFDEFGFSCISVPDNKKNKVDRRMIEDCREQVLSRSEPSILILISGDSDFIPLVNELRAAEHQVIIIGNRQASQKLKKAATHYYDFQDSRNIEHCFSPKAEDVIVQSSLNKTVAVKTKLSYREAVDCLIQTVDDLLARKQAALLNRVDVMMRKTNAFYQGASSIYTPEGKKFRGFKKFVEAAAREGKIAIKTQGEQLELILGNCFPPSP